MMDAEGARVGDNRRWASGPRSPSSREERKKDVQGERGVGDNENLNRPNRSP